MQEMPRSFMPTVWAALRNCCAKLPFLFKEETLNMKSDIEIAQEAKMKPIADSCRLVWGWRTKTSSRMAAIRPRSTTASSIRPPKQGKIDPGDGHQPHAGW